MDEHIAAVIDECSKGSEAGRMRFPDVLDALGRAGVERYDVDLVRAEKRFYLPDGASRVVGGVPLADAPAEAFAASDVEAAIRAVQAGRLSYLEFCAALAAAGCVAYTVSLAGRRAVYHGRTAESVTERFPD